MGAVAGDWLERRPGDLLRFLICKRGGVVAEDQIAEALWPGAHSANASNRVRQTVYVLRRSLNPGRPSRSPAEFVVSRQGGYELDAERVWVDADRFEDQVRAGLTALSQGQEEVALRHLEDAIGLYRDDFFADAPYLEWALEERDHLREVAGRALRALSQLHSSAGDLPAAREPARRLAAMEPLDTDIQRDFLEICLKQGRRSEATRRYELLARRLRKEFGEEPDFSLSDLD